MTFQQFAFALITSVMIFLLAACGSQNSSQPAIVITFTEGFLPPTSIMVSDSCGVAATVTNDRQEWRRQLDGCLRERQCGGFAGSGASSIPLTYTAPAAIPSGNTVTLTATSATDPTKFVSSARFQSPKMLP